MWRRCDVPLSTAVECEAESTTQRAQDVSLRPGVWRSCIDAGCGFPSESEPDSQMSSQNSSFVPMSRAASPTAPPLQELFPPQQRERHRYYHHNQQQQQQLQQQQQQQFVIRQEDIRDADFERLKVLGDGSYSVVVAARHRPSQQIVALKELSRRRLRELNLEKQLQWEINVHRTLRHPNVVRMLSYYVTPQTVVLVLEMCPRGTLLQKLRSMPAGRFDERRAARYVRQAARALVYLHGHGIAHRDLKLENILLDARGVARLGDFGWSRVVAPPAGEGAQGRGDDAGRLTVCGTLDYLSPEMLRGMPHTFKTDVWSLGVVLAEMLSGTPPFYCVSQQDTLNAICEAAPRFGEDVQISSLAHDLVSGMLQKNPDDRPTMVEVLQHPWTRHDRDNKRGMEKGV